MRIRYAHWNQQEADARAGEFVGAGFEVNAAVPTGSRFLKELESEAVDAVVIDLSRLPSQGRDLAVAIRRRKGTRHIPIIFVDEDGTKAETVRKVLPDAAFIDWDRIIETVEGAIQAAAEPVVVPDSAFAAYAGKPLVEKLGMKAGDRVSLVHAPEGFIRSLKGLPRGVDLIEECDAQADLVLWFASTTAQLEEDLEQIAAASRAGPVWITWPKGGSAKEKALTQQVVRETAMNAGLVDYKIISIDRKWSALLFTWRGDPKPTTG